MARPPLFLRLLKGFAIVGLSGMFGIAALFGVLWLEHRSAVTLPTPTGSFAVGREIQDWTDSAAVDTLAPLPERSASSSSGSGIPRSPDEPP